jgi:hypothetical protein
MHDHTNVEFAIFTPRYFEVLGLSWWQAAEIPVFTEGLSINVL